MKPAAPESKRCILPVMWSSVCRVLTEAAPTVRADFRGLGLVRTPRGAEEIKPVRAIRTSNGMGIFEPHRTLLAESQMTILFQRHPMRPAREMRLIDTCCQHSCGVGAGLSESSISRSTIAVN